MKILVFAALLLAALIYFRPHQGYSLSDSASEEAKIIRIAREGMPEIVLQKSEKGWEITRPVKGMASPDKVANVLSLLKARSGNRLEAREISRFGLEKPVLRISIDSEEFDFGMLNPVTGQQYVAKGNAVYLISAKYALVPSLSELEEDHAGAS